jgi:hypothetical protein
LEDKIIVNNLQNSDDYLIAIKARFKSPSYQVYGQLIIILNSNKNFESFSIVASSSSDLYNLEPHASWDTYEQAIAKQIWDGEYNKNLTVSLMYQLQKIPKDKRMLEMLYKDAVRFDCENLELTLFEILHWIITDKNLNLDLGIQEISKSEFQEGRSNRSTKKKAEEKGNELNEGIVMLPIEAIISPIKGKPIFELKIGDIIMVKIKPLSEREKKYIDSLGLRKDKDIKPTPAEVIDIRISTEKIETIEIITQISPKIYGVLYEEEKKVKIRIYDPNLDGPINLKNISAKNMISNDLTIKPIEKNWLSLNMLIIFGIFVIILIIFITLVLLYW